MRHLDKTHTSPSLGRAYSRALIGFYATQLVLVAIALYSLTQ